MVSIQNHTKKKLLEDEQGSLSASRVFLALHLLQTTAYIWLHDPLSGVVLTYDSAIATALIAWAGGARVAQYIGPQIGAAATAVAQSIKEAVTKRRDPDDGIESTP